MAEERIPSLIMQIIEELRAQGVLITNYGGEWCVKLRSTADATGYVTDDLLDAFEHGRALAAAPGNASPAEAIPPTIRRKWRRPMSAKAQRRRFIRQHNRRMRGRALRRQREAT